MERIGKALRFFVVSSLLFAFTLPGVAHAQDNPAVVPGVITASNVDVTADDGSLLSERLGVGDMVYIVLQPTNERKGWVRITRSPEDTVGFGWVEVKNIQRFAAYRSSGSASSRSAPTSTYREKKSQGGVAVLPFETTDSNDSYGRTLTKQFADALKAKRKFKVINNIPGQGLDQESVQEVRSLLVRHGLKGIIVGKLSSPFGGNRILQIKYLGKDSSSFTIEKVKRISSKSDSKKVMRELADVYAKNLGR